MVAVGNQLARGRLPESLDICMRNLLFPGTLNRLTYVIRLLIFLAVVLSFRSLAGQVLLPRWVLVILGCSLCLARIACMDVPRLRSMRWSVWLAPLMLTPVVFVLQFFLLFVAPRTKDV